MAFFKNFEFKIFCSIFIFLILPSVAIAFDAFPKETIEILPLPNFTLNAPITRLGWNGVNNFFATTDEKYQIFIEGETNDVFVQKLPENPFSVDELSATSSEYDSSSETSDYSVPAEKQEVCVTSISKDGRFIAVGTKTGSIFLMDKENPVFPSGENPYAPFIKFEEKHGDEVTSINFSEDNSYIISAGKDGNIFVWSLLFYQIISTLQGDKESALPVYFSYDGQSVINITKNNEITFRNFESEILNRISLEFKVKDYSISPEDKIFYLLDETDKLFLYDVDTATFMGYVPPFKLSKITSFSFNEFTENLLVGHEDGSVFVLQTNSVLLLPDATPPNLQTDIADDEDGTSDTEKSDKSKKNDKEKEDKNDEFDFEDERFGKARHNIEMRVDFTTMNEYYTMAIKPSIGYINSALVENLYLGVLAKFCFAFPDTDFPYTYVVDDKIVNSLELVGLSFVVPVGYSFAPFQTDFTLFAEAQIGASFYAFFVPNYGLSEIRYPSFSTALWGGFSWKQFSIYLGVDYDFRLGLCFSGGAGWCIRLGK